MPLLLKGQPVAEAIQQHIHHRLTTLPSPPTLAVIMVGDNPASLSYIGRKQRLADQLGINFQLNQLPTQTTTPELVTLIATYNQRPDITGILVQMPLPSHLDQSIVLQAINPRKDVDGLTWHNLGALLANRPQIVPATAKGIMVLLDHYNIQIAGQLVTVVGRSQLVGLPVAHLLLRAGATVTIAHRQTANLAVVTKQAAILVVAAGHPGLITAEHVTAASVVIDVGLSRTNTGLMGDVDPHLANQIRAITPVPGGVGPLTVTCLFDNLLQAADLQIAHGK
jgi:methylenetetrahydrofolate dehydrogenase (NADP+)/methenyltetrahydrofolate cyclohydrolase